MYYCGITLSIWDTILENTHPKYIIEINQLIYNFLHAYITKHKFLHYISVELTTFKDVCNFNVYLFNASIISSSSRSRTWQQRKQREEYINGKISPSWYICKLNKLSFLTKDFGTHIQKLKTIIYVLYTYLWFIPEIVL